MSSDPIAGLAEPARPLRRIHDEILEYRATAEMAKAHLRIWRGPAAEGDRVVVLIGDLTDGPAGITNWIETIATQAQALVGDHPALALWFDYHPGQHAVDHIQFRWSRTGRLLTRRAGWKASSPRWSGVSVSDVERLVGAPVECYPAAAYTATSTERWRRDGGELAIVHDSIDLGGAAAALRHLGETDPGNEWTATAAQACSVLATDLRERLDALHGLEWDDGTRPPRGARSGWPTCFAARLVPPSLTPEDQAVLARYPQRFERPRSADDTRELRSLLARLQVWRDETGEHADHPKPAIHDAVNRAHHHLSRAMRGH